MTTPERHIEVAKTILGRALAATTHMGDGITAAEVRAARDYLTGLPQPNIRPTLIYFGSDGSRVHLSLDDPDPLPHMSYRELTLCKGMISGAGQLVDNELSARQRAR